MEVRHIYICFAKFCSPSQGKNRLLIVLKFWWDIGLGRKIKPIDFGVYWVCILITVIKKVHFGRIQSSVWAGYPQ